MAPVTDPKSDIDPREAAPVLTERRGGVLIVTINRPHAKNAVNAAVAKGVAAAMDELDGDPQLNVGVLTGAGGTFCAGMDLKAFVKGENPMDPQRGFGGVAFGPPRKPLIAAVEGWALAGGCEIVLSCDLVVAARTAKFGIPEVKRGLAAAAGGLFRLPMRIPYHVAMELVLTGDPVEAPRAYELGLVNRLTDEGGALDAALELAAKIAANGPLAVAASKEVVQKSRGLVGRGGPGRPAGDRRSGDAQPGRAGGRHRVRREAPAGLEGALTLERAAVLIEPVAFARVATLVAELDADLTVRYGGDGDPVHAPAAEFDGPGGEMLLATVNGAQVGCVGLRRVDERTGGAEADVRASAVAPVGHRPGAAGRVRGRRPPARLRAALARDRNDAAGGGDALPFGGLRAGSRVRPVRRCRAFRSTSDARWWRMSRTRGADQCRVRERTGQDTLKRWWTPDGCREATAASATPFSSPAWRPHGRRRSVNVSAATSSSCSSAWSASSLRR